MLLNSLSDVVSVNSPGYPNVGQSELLCDFIIRGPVNAGLQISFAIERWSSCNKTAASLEIYDGGSDLSPLIETVCMPPFAQRPVITSSHIALLRYAVRGGEHSSKFNATIKIDNCNREMIVGRRAERGLRLPYTTKSASSSSANLAAITECSYHFKTYPTMRITLNITQLFLMGNSCTAGDVVSFYDSPYQTSVSFRQYCAPKNKSDVNYVIKSSKNELYVTYKRINYYQTSSAKAQEVGIKFDVASKYTGKFLFLIKFFNNFLFIESDYKIIDGNLKPRGIIRFSATAATESRTYSEWRLDGDIGTRFRLHFERLNLGKPMRLANLTGLPCSKKLTISYNFILGFNNNEVFDCTNEVLPADIITPTNIVKLLFVAENLAPREGFLISYTMLYDNQSCSALYDSPRTSIISTNFTNINSTGYFACLWQVKLQVNQSATLLLDTYDVPGDCVNKTLFITGVVKERYRYHRMTSDVCIPKEAAPQNKGVKFIQPIFWKNDYPVNPSILFSFNRTEAGKSKGLRGELFIQKCGGHFVNAFGGEFTSQNYPNDYGTDVFCNYYFELKQDGGSDNGYRLIFTEFDIGDNCEEDFFLVIDFIKNF